MRGLEVSLLAWEEASWQSDVWHSLLQAEDEAKAAGYLDGEALLKAKAM